MLLLVSSVFALSAARRLTETPLPDNVLDIGEMFVLLPDTDARPEEQSVLYNLDPDDGTYREFVPGDGEYSNESSYVPGSRSRRDEPQVHKSHGFKKTSTGVLKDGSHKRALSIFMALPNSGGSVAAVDTRVAGARGKLLRPYGMPLRWG